MIFLFLSIPLCQTVLKSLRERPAVGHAGHLWLSQLILESRSKPASCVRQTGQWEWFQFLLWGKKNHCCQLAHHGVISIFQCWTGMPEPSRAETRRHNSLQVPWSWCWLWDKLQGSQKTTYTFIWKMLEIGLQRSNTCYSCLTHSRSLSVQRGPSSPLTRLQRKEQPGAGVWCQAHLSPTG